MSAIEMDKELERIGGLRRSLEPLAVLYEKAVLEAGKEPFEVRLTTQQSTDHLSESYHGADTFHIIDGESLQAVHEIWQEYRRIELQLLEQSEESLPDSLTYLNAAEQEWLEWFYHLSDEDKKIVEECGEKDISVTSDNLDEMKQNLEEQETKDLDFVIQLFKD